MALGGEVVDLVRTNLTNQTNQAVAVRQVAVMQLHLRFGTKDQVFDPLRAKRAGTAAQTVHLVAFFKQQFCEVRTVLTRDTRDQGTPLHR